MVVINSEERTETDKGPCIDCGEVTRATMFNKITGNEFYMCDPCVEKMQENCDTSSEIRSYMNQLIAKNQAASEVPK